MDKTNALVSIIVPVYGTESYLPTCIESLRKQSYPHLQIILVDDQSPDGCPEICDRYAEMDSRITVIHQKNKGVSGARNTGLDHAAGDFLLFVDSDDELYPEAVERMLQDAAEHHADIVSAVKRIADETGRTVSSCEDGDCRVFRDEEPLLLSLAGERNTNSACAKLFRAEFILGIRFVEGKNINEDGFFVFQCYLRKPVLVQHNIAVYQYNSRQESNSKQAFSEKYLSMLYFCERKKELIAAQYPQYMEQAYNMEVRTNLQMLQVLYRTADRQYRNLQKQCIRTVRRLYRYHRPINDSHRKLAWAVRCGLYPLYKFAVRLKYFR